MSEENKEIVVEETATAEVEAATMESVLYDPTAPIVTLRNLLEAGVHFGHPTRKWDPKMKPFIYTARNNIYIIDLVKTAEQIKTAYDKLKEIVEKGGKVLFVGTKAQVKEVIASEALRSGSFYINNRWLGGILTNFKTIQTRIRLLKELELQETEGNFEGKTKKEISILMKEKEKLVSNLEGIKEMRRVPDAIVLVDPSVEHNAVNEAKILNIPVFGIVDTNCSPANIDYVIPGNDDAVKSVKLLTGILADAIVEAKGGTPTVAFIKDEGEEFTMKDAIKQVDKENAARLAAIREQRRLKQEAYEKAMAERQARYAAKKEKREYKKPVETKTEETKGE